MTCVIFLGIIFLMILIVFIVYIFLFKKDFLVSKSVENKFGKMKCIETHTGYLESNADVEEFYEGSPENSYYIEYLKRVSKDALKFLKRPELNSIVGKTIIVDIDDTLVYTRENQINPKKEYENHPKYGKVIHYKPIKPIVNLIKKASKLGYTIIVITARPPQGYQNSLTNLHRIGIYPDALFTSLFWKQDPSFKAIMRNKIEHLKLKEIKKMSSSDLFNCKPKIKKNLLNLKIIMTIGDKWPDVTDMDNTLGLKLPEESDMNAYYWFNGETRII